MHIEENKIAVLVFSPDMLDESEKDSMFAHINECGLCKEIFDATKNIYDDVITKTEDPATANDKEFAAKIYTNIKGEKNKSLTLKEKLLPLSGSVVGDSAVEIYNGKTQIVEIRKTFSLQNIFYYVKRHPVVSGGFALVGALAFAFVIMTYKGAIKNNNPVYADIKEGILKIYNSDGELLWKKTVGNIPDTKLDEPITEKNRFNKRYLSLLDIDNDNKNEVLISGATNDGLFTIDSLYCFESNGKLRWTTSAGKFTDFGTERWQHGRWHITDFFTVYSNGRNNLIVIANDAVYAPLIISKVDPGNGNVVSSYYHCGWNFEARAQKLDVNGDGNEEIIIGLTNNAYRKAALLVLSSDRLEGMSPANTDFYPSYLKGKELYYILFPITNLGQKFARAYSFIVSDLYKSSKGITALTRECPGDPDLKECRIIYSFDNSLNVLNAIGSAEFNRNYDELYKKGAFTETKDSNYFQNLVDSVKYWDGDKFVSYHTMNKYYSTETLMPPLP